MYIFCSINKISTNRLLYPSERNTKSHLEINERKAKWGDPGNYRGILLLLVLAKTLPSVPWLVS